MTKLAAPSKPCRIPSCPNARPCPVDGHEPRAWEGSHRRERIGLSGSREQRRARRVIRRHRGICHVCGLGGADEADHVIPVGEGGPDTEANMRPIHSEPCHRIKTQEEAQRARTGGL